jgi:hypothetical protein
MPNRYFKKEERKQQILLALCIKAQHGGEPKGTAYTIAKLIDMAVSPNLYSILADMVAERRLDVRSEVLGGRGERTWYILPEETARECAGHEISIRINGTIYEERLI